MEENRESLPSAELVTAVKNNDPVGFCKQKCDASALALVVTNLLEEEIDECDTSRLSEYVLRGLKALKASGQFIQQLDKNKDSWSDLAAQRDIKTLYVLAAFASSISFANQCVEKFLKVEPKDKYEQNAAEEPCFPYHYAIKDSKEPNMTNEKIQEYGNGLYAQAVKTLVLGGEKNVK